MKKQFKRLILYTIFSIYFSVCFTGFTGNIDANNKYVWSANTGWTNMETASGSVTVQDAYLSGYAWNENTGWMKLGNDLGGPYNNTSASDWGVNNDGHGNLSGYAWSSSCGWINFKTAQNQVKIDTSGNFSGYAWNQNTGWIHFANADTVSYKVSSTWNPSYTVTATSAENGTVSPTTQMVEHGKNSVPITATADAHYHFVQWDDGNTDNPRTITNVTADTTITASFAIDQFKVTVKSAGNGTVDPATQIDNYGSNSTEISATADANYHFVQWDDGNTDNPRTITNVTEATTITASFAIDTYTLSYTATVNGSIYGISPQIVNHSSSGTKITAIPTTGYHFVNWSDGLSDNPRTDTNVTKNITVTVNFAIDQFTVTAHSNGNGTVAPINQTIDYGSNSLKITATPAANYHFVQWNDRNTDNPRIISNVTERTTILAEFAINTSTVTFKTDGTEGVSLDGELSQVVEYDANCSTINASGSDKVTFKNWTGTNGFKTTDANPLTVTNVTSDMVITANFTAHSITNGNIVTVYAKDIPGLGEYFTKSPKLYAELTPIGKKLKRFSLSKLTKISKETQSDFFQAIWKKSIPLFDTKELKSANKGGMLTSLWLSHHKIADLPFHLIIKTKEFEKDLGIKTLAPPLVTEILNANGSPLGPSINKGETITVKGLYFGQRAPKVSLEYLDASGKIKRLKLKVLTPLEYDDSKGKSGNSCMNPLTGESTIKLQVLKASKPLPDGYDGGFDLIIDNKFGIAIDKSTARVPSIKIIE